jgi:choline transport protein
MPLVRFASIPSNNDKTDLGLGQVFWTAALSPPKWARFLSYWNGATTSLGWIFANTGTFIFTADIFAATIEIRNPGWVVQPYQIFLLSVACAAAGLILNIWLFNYYPYVTKFMVVFINLATVYVLVALLVRTHPKASAQTVFLNVINETGWSSNALVFLLCFLPGCVAISCFDTAAHMSEEMDGFDSPALLTIATICYCVAYLSSCPATIATGSRLIWSFAKHGGLPCGKWIAYVEPKSQIPVNSVYLTTIVASLIGLLVFGPTTVLNGVFGAGSVCFFFSYGMPIWLSVASRRSKLSSTRYFNLGKLGMPINILTIMWQLITVVFLCFPVYVPVNGTNMNWASLSAVIGLVVFAVNWVFYAGKHYRTPQALFVEGIHGHTA